MSGSGVVQMAQVDVDVDVDVSEGFVVGLTERTCSAVLTGWVIEWFR